MKVKLTHAAKVLADLEAEIKVRREEIERLTACQAGLNELYGEELSGDVTETTSLPDRSKTPAKKEPKKETPKPMVEGGARPTLVMPPELASPETVKIMAVARTCAEPFTAASLAVATERDVVQCRNAISRWKTKGWVVNAERGSYKRTGDFPALTPVE